MSLYWKLRWRPWPNRRDFLRSHCLASEMLLVWEAPAFLAKSLNSLKMIRKSLRINPLSKSSMIMRLNYFIWMAATSPRARENTQQSLVMKSVSNHSVRLLMRILRPWKSNWLIQTPFLQLSQEDVPLQPTKGQMAREVPKNLIPPTAINLKAPEFSRLKTRSPSNMTGKSPSILSSSTRSITGEKSDSRSRLTRC